MDFEFLVRDVDVGQRLDVVTTSAIQEACTTDEDIRQWCMHSSVTRNKVVKWIESGGVIVDGSVVQKASFRLKANSVVKVELEPDAPLSVEPDSSVPINVVYEDEAILVVNKPPNLVVHPGAGHHDKTLVNGLVHYLGMAVKAVGSAERPGLVHRLDKDTSGLLVVAKTSRAYEALVKQFEQRVISRVYVALTLRIPSVENDLDWPIGRHLTDRSKMDIRTERGKVALTRWSVREVLKSGVLLELRLATGRTHQIRVHLKAAGAPIVGDLKYGCSQADIPKHLRGAVRKFGRQALHAIHLILSHPYSGEKMQFDAPLPRDMQDIIELFRVRNDGG